MSDGRKRIKLPLQTAEYIFYTKAPKINWDKLKEDDFEMYRTMKLLVRDAEYTIKLEARTGVIE